MAFVKCLACDGEYFDVLPDGVRYFHACAPVFDAGKKMFVERPNARDENVTPGVVNGKPGMVAKSAGAGTATLATPSL